MELLSLFITSVIPVIKVLLVLAIGLFLATGSVDLLGPNARHHLNNVSLNLYIYIYCIDKGLMITKSYEQLVFYVFLPALIGCRLADMSTVKSLETL